MSEMVHIHRFECHGRNKEFVPLDEYRTLRDERDRLALDLKKRIWLLHGARMNHLLYGDDGRMDCNVCFREYAGATLEQCYEWEIADACALIAKAALTPAGQRWTREVPSLPVGGAYYWWSFKGSTPEILYCRSESMVVRPGETEPYLLSDFDGGYWLGPVERPITPEATE